MSPIIRPLSKTLGAEVTGVDLSLDIDDSTFQTLRSTLPSISFEERLLT
jgi:alpha-ketoglutarate-dependent taurine dioxygenase